MSVADHIAVTVHDVPAVDRLDDVLATVADRLGLQDVHVGERDSLPATRNHPAFVVARVSGTLDGLHVDVSAFSYTAGRP